MDKPTEDKRYVANLTGGPFTEVEPFRFAEDERASLTEVLSNTLNLPADSPSIQSFLEAAERAAAAFKQLQELERKKPASRTTHATMAKLRKHVPALRKTMEAMDAEVRWRLLFCLQSPIFHGNKTPITAENKSPGKASEEIEAPVPKKIAAESERSDLAENFIGRLTLELVAFDAATEMAEAMLGKPARGPKKKLWREQFATEIAWVFWLRIGIEPTATQAGDAAKDDSAFESVLRICLHAVGVNLKSVHKLALAAMENIKVQKRFKK